MGSNFVFRRDETWVLLINWRNRNFFLRHLTQKYFFLDFGYLEKKKLKKTILLESEIFWAEIVNWIWNTEFFVPVLKKFKTFGIKTFFSMSAIHLKFVSPKRTIFFNFFFEDNTRPCRFCISMMFGMKNKISISAIY